MELPVAPFIERSVKIPGMPFRMLEPVDQVIHGIVNIAHTGEFSSRHP